MRAGAGRFCLLLVPAIWLCGCTEGIRWKGPTFADAFPLAQAGHKLTFVYFRSWYLVECTHFEEEVLKNSAVLAETQSMVCVPLDFDNDRLFVRPPLTEKWGITKVPAVVIVTPEGDVLARGQAPITVQALLGMIRDAKVAFAAGVTPATQPAAP